jgi:DNA topoisomerase-1
VLITDDLPSELSWADDQGPGITRRRAGTGFSYRQPNGKRADERTVARIRALAVPPAWTDVWINPSPHGHLQATGRDARGRKQYRYHPEFRAHRERLKFAHLDEFGGALPAIRSQVTADLDLPGVPHDRVVATVVRLLETTFVRVGNEEYARSNNSYGLTTLRNRHAHFTSNGLQLVFRGKHGSATNVKVQDTRLRRVVRACQDLPGQTLFQYRDDDGIARPVTSTDVNEYLRAASGLDISAKDFRTWMGTLLAAITLVDMSNEETSATRRRRTVKQAMEQVSDALRNTPAVARASYVHPAVVEWFEDGSLEQRWDAASARGSRLLLPEERKLLRLLKQANRHSGRLAAAA